MNLRTPTSDTTLLFVTRIARMFARHALKRTADKMKAH